MNPILQVQNLTGGYSRKRPVIHNITFDIYPREMIGLIGLNGAGKSTTIKHILGLLQPAEGSVRIHNQTLKEAPELYRASYTYVPETPLVYDDLTLWEHLELTAMAYGLERKVFEERVESLLAEFNMQDKKRMFPQHMSKGMRQKMMIMNAFLVRPVLYIIDEPFVGLDPRGIRSLLELMVKMKNTGAAILMSSHILSTVERYCDKFIVLHNGRIRAAGTLEEIRRQAGMAAASLDDVFYELTKDGANDGR
ncbi:ABC-2 type transport system ATP-binding protein [Aneurinibacillus thermoaerophilus]|uniref:ABC transporter ATP-binding protein n=1 Tax=Aneurinibacillus thermoaerophilus TaxID=143495 RepID=A0A1G8CB56_ANETH|nr:MULTISPECIES: ABC transporter ATP-binding protein [Aneurinibacillus]AMA71568.1 multidrug ABC transporter ATP-binding protein [Aneurinibacillus sp. XH2]MED0675403.1 ABC transporter ATP-binding protein [Aneurinibacillus thermoaerophilus]QYY42681.1 ABC transporter ATP-binding protein [Aneurinibacillus thermoaerophilus]SDH42694.1 ABC-2 type transport system ATP-binding protein [Aneurinibacillus thermoaerophilus]